MAQIYSKQARNRIGRAVRWVERQEEQKPFGRKAWPFWEQMIQKMWFGVVQTSDIGAGSSGKIKKLRDGVETDDTLTVWLKYMHNSEKVSVGKEVLVAYFPNEPQGERWIIIGAECETA